MKFQLLTGLVNLGGDRDNVAFRGTDNPMTYPEMLVLRHVHGREGSAEDHVFDLEEIGEVERSVGEERLRLMGRYGAKAVNEILPTSLPDAMFPARDDKLPSADDVLAAKNAAAKVLAERKAKKDTKPDAKTKTPEPETKVSEPTPALGASGVIPGGIPGLDQLPTK